MHAVNQTLPAMQSMGQGKQIGMQSASAYIMKWVSTKRSPPVETY